MNYYALPQSPAGAGSIGVIRLRESLLYFSAAAAQYSWMGTNARRSSVVLIPFHPSILQCMQLMCNPSCVRVRAIVAAQHRAMCSTAAATSVPLFFASHSPSLSSPFRLHVIRRSENPQWAKAAEIAISTVAACMKKACVPCVLRYCVWTVDCGTECSPPRARVPGIQD